jgi:import receptor subunit TOM20
MSYSILGPESAVEAALCFYKALKVYPQPRSLISIYDNTVPKVCCYRDGSRFLRADYAPQQPILDILAEMIASDPSIPVGLGGGPPSDGGAAGVE